MSLMGQPFALWSVFVAIIGIGGLTVLTWLSLETEKIDEETGRVIRPENNPEA